MDKHEIAVESGRLGGRIGGKAKVPKGFSLRPKKDRVAMAKKAAEARWKKIKPECQS